MDLSKVAVTSASESDLPSLVRFFRAVAAAEAPNDPAALERGEAGLRDALAGFDFLQRDGYPLLLARVDGESAGYLQAVIIPKADARVGYLFVDEIYVLPAYRRRGVGRALVPCVQTLAGELGLAGVRLLVRPGNAAARELYRSCGFAEHKTLFCEWQGERRRGEGETG